MAKKGKWSGMAKSLSEELLKEDWIRHHELRKKTNLVILGGMDYLEKPVRKGIEQCHAELGLDLPKMAGLEPSGRLLKEILWYHRACYDAHKNYLDFKRFKSFLDREQRNHDGRIIAISPAQSTVTGETSDSGDTAILICYGRLQVRYGPETLPNAVKHELGHAILRKLHHNNDGDKIAWDAGEIDKSCIMATTASIKGERHFCSLCQIRAVGVREKDKMYDLV